MNLQRLLLITTLATFALLSLTDDRRPDLVIEIFRHGARGPLNQTYDPNPTWGDNIEQLTAVGMRMHYLLGTAIRDQYSDILTGYDPAKIYVRSTDRNRTIMSGYSHLYGVYNGDGPSLNGSISQDKAIPPYTSAVIDDTIKSMNTTNALPNNFQVVPIHVVTKDEDMELVGFDQCPLSKVWFEKNSNSRIANSVFKNEMGDLVTYLRNQSLKINSFEDLATAGDNAIANKYQGKDLPGHVVPDSKLYKDLKFSTEWLATQKLFGMESQKELYAVPLLLLIKDYFNGIKNGTSSLDFVFLSAHDSTLLTLLAAFNITTPQCMLENYRSGKPDDDLPNPNCLYPAYASNVIFEFYNDPVEPYVIFYYNGNEINICGTEGENCSLDQFDKYTDSITSVGTVLDFKAQCGFQDAMVIEQMEYSYTLLYFLIAFCLILTAGLITTCVILRKKISKLEGKEGMVSFVSQL